ncbi:MAG: fluoride efflux transporter CrcB [Verrucomicrobiota bacterium]
MKPLLLVAAGGVIGALARFALAQVMAKSLTDSLFPWPILTVNLLGCLAFGILAEIGIERGLLTAGTQLFLFTGILGSFTTFSTFGYETLYLLRSDKILLALSYVLASVIGGVLALYAGTRLVAKLS